MTSQPHALRVELANRQSQIQIDSQQLIDGVQLVLGEASLVSGSVSLAVVDDPAIHDINRTYLKHDYPTDVLSFVLEGSSEHFEGEIIASAETAAREAPRFGWTSQCELLLYFLHGALHLVGYRDQSPEDAAQLCQAQSSYLARMGVLGATDEQSRNLRGPLSVLHGERTT